MASGGRLRVGAGATIREGTRINAGVRSTIALGPRVLVSEQSTIDAANDVPPGPVTMMCGHGERAMTAAAILVAHGRADVSVLAGGPDDWATATGRALA